MTPARSLVAADLLKLARRRGLLVVVSLLTVGAAVATYGIIELLHLGSPHSHGPAGGVVSLGHGAWLLSTFGEVAAAIVGSVAGVGDLDAGVYRDLVVTGRSRLALYASRVPSGLAFLLPLVVAGYAVAAIAGVFLADGQPVPGIGLLSTSGLWVLLEVSFYFLLALGIACLIGSRSYTIGIVLGFRLALTPILASVPSLGSVRELVPGVGLENLAPSAIASEIRQGPSIPMSVHTITAVLLVWALAALALGAWRDTRRDA